MSSIARIAVAVLVCTLVASTLAEAQTRREARTVNVQPRSFLDAGKPPVSSGGGPSYVTMGQYGGATPYYNQLGARETGAPFHSNTPFWGY
jgi:hypothetical protein